MKRTKNNNTEKCIPSSRSFSLHIDRRKGGRFHHKEMVAKKVVVEKKYNRIPLMLPAKRISLTTLALTAYQSIKNKQI